MFIIPFKYSDRETGQSLSYDDMDSRYRDMLDEFNSPYRIHGIEFSASRILATDETAYRIGFINWMDEQIENGTIVESGDGKWFIVRTRNGKRRYLATDKGCALQQHYDTFGLADDDAMVLDVYEAESTNEN